MCFRISCLFCACMVVSCLMHHACGHHHHIGSPAEDTNPIQQLFLKYGHSDNRLSFEELESLLTGLGLKFSLSSDAESPKSLPTTVSPAPPETDETSDSSKIEDTKSPNVTEPHHHESHSHHHNHKCLENSTIVLHYNLSQSSFINAEQFKDLCPAILHQLDLQNCDHHIDAQFSFSSTDLQYDAYVVWLYAFVAIFVISLCGLISVAIIPMVHEIVYQPLLQLLIGLAVGSLTGDALLHLLPHAMSMVNTKETHHHVSDHHEHFNVEQVWQGLSALIGAFAFFLVERALNMISNFRHHHHRAEQMNGHRSLSSTSLPKLVTTVADPGPNKVVGEKLSHHKHGSYGYSMDPTALESLQSLNNEGEALEESSRGCECHSPIVVDERDCHRETVVYRHDDMANSYVVTVTGHHHHHSHGSSSSIAWVVIIGDALHNFCDGMAIGAAFAGDIAGGLSTAIAVFCHELPHEMGDFAILLKTGMTARQALFYNGISSVVCFFGTIVGLLIGRLTTSMSWIYSSAAGMFLYIAFVDMMPQLSTGPSGTKHYLVFQMTGIVIGIVIMLVIALYEHELVHIVS